MRVVVLDRDGVINADREDYVKSTAEWQPLSGSLEALGRLTHAGYEVVVATNQSGIGRGLYTEAAVNGIHRHLRREAARHGGRIAGFYVCPHAPLAGCDCRKPAPGMLRRIAADFGVPTEELVFIGDTGKDLAAARAVGARGMLVLTGQGGDTLAAERAAGREPENYSDLARAVDGLVAGTPGKLEQGLRSLAYNASYMVNITLWGIAAFACAMTPGGRRGLEAVARGHARAFFRLLRWWAGTDMHIEGRENLPEGPFVFYWKHQSTWETMAPFLLVRSPAFVLKRELLWIPFVGWALARLGAVGINRGSGRKAMEQVLSRGRRLIERGSTMVIFPEGHRMPPGKTKRYGVSGALLARGLGLPIVPVAHNAGDFWPRRSFVKRRGTVRVVIGPPVPTVGRAPEEINVEAKRWIEAEMGRISLGYQHTGS